MKLNRGFLTSASLLLFAVFYITYAFFGNSSDFEFSISKPQVQNHQNTEKQKPSTNDQNFETKFKTFIKGSFTDNYDKKLPNPTFTYSVTGDFALTQNKESDNLASNQIENQNLVSQNQIEQEEDETFMENDDVIMEVLNELDGDLSLQNDNDDLSANNQFTEYPLFTE